MADHDDSIECKEEAERAEGSDARGGRWFRGRCSSRRGAKRAQLRQHRAAKQFVPGEMERDFRTLFSFFPPHSFSSPLSALKFLNPTRKKILCVETVFKVWITLMSLSADSL